MMGPFIDTVEHFQSDNGGEFVDCERWAKKEGVGWIHIRTRHPQADGLIEARNNLIQQQLEKLQVEAKTKLWHLLLPKAVSKPETSPLQGSKRCADLFAQGT